VKFDKEMVIAFILCGALLIFWQPLCVWMGWMPDPAAPVQGAVQTAAVPATVPAVQKEAPAAAGTSRLPVPAQIKPAVRTLPAVLLGNDDIACEILPEAGAIRSITLKNFRTADREKQISIDQLPSAGTPAGALQPGATGVFFPGMSMTLDNIVRSEQKGSLYTLVRDVTLGKDARLRITQEWTLGRSNTLAMNLKVANTGRTTAEIPVLAVSGGELQAWSNVSGDTLRMDSFRLDYYTADGSYNDVNADAKDKKFFRNAGNVRWEALSNKFFISVLQAKQPFNLYQARVPEPGKSDRYFAAAGAAYSGLKLAPESTSEWQFELYAGPKNTAKLKAFAPDADRTMHMAWGPLDYLARLLLWVLIQLKGVCGSYGWSIIILTIIVRLLFWPATAKANASMKKMSRVQPKIQELRAKYKDNPQMLNTKMMELYRTEGVNPMGGCLPILLQIPVFFALYATLDGAVELRQVSFWWAQDLAAPDTVCHIFGLPVNPLVLAMTLLMVLQQRLTPTAMEPMQQKMMMIMPIVMLFFLYNLPSGLTLYWTVSQIFSILQMLLQKHYNTATPAPKAGSAQKA